MTKLLYSHLQTATGQPVAVASAIIAASGRDRSDVTHYTSIAYNNDYIDEDVVVFVTFLV